MNKMLPTNVAIVFGPTVMRAEMDSIEVMYVRTYV